MSDDGAAEPEANVPTSENGDAAKDAADDTGVLQEAKTAVARQQRQLQLLAERFAATADAARGETASLRQQVQALTREVAEARCAAGIGRQVEEGGGGFGAC